MAVFADTFYWIAITSPLDSAHQLARKFTQDLVTTHEVLTEYLNFFCASPEHLRRKAGQSVQAIVGAATVHVIAQTQRSFEEGFELYRARPDKGYSLTDCISMQTMKREGLIDVLTNDRHFEQEGFRVLLRNPSS